MVSFQMKGLCLLLATTAATTQARLSSTNGNTSYRTITNVDTTDRQNALGMNIDETSETLSNEQTLKMESDMENKNMMIMDIPEATKQTEMTLQSEQTTQMEEETQHDEMMLAIDPEYEAVLGYLNLAPELEEKEFTFYHDEQTQEIVGILRKSWTYDFVNFLDVIEQPDNVVTQWYKPTPIIPELIYDIGLDASTTTVLQVEFPDNNFPDTPITIPDNSKVTTKANGNFIVAYTVGETVTQESAFRLKIKYENKPVSIKGCQPLDTYRKKLVDHCFDESGSITIEDGVNAAIFMDYTQLEAMIEVETSGSIWKLKEDFVTQYNTDRENGMDSVFIKRLDSYVNTWDKADYADEMFWRLMNQPIPSEIKVTEDRDGSWSLETFPLETIDEEAKIYLIERLIEWGIVPNTFYQWSDKALKLCESASSLGGNDPDRASMVDEALKLWKEMSRIYSGHKVFEDYEKDGKSIFKMIEDEGKYWGTVKEVEDLEQGNMILISDVNKDVMQYLWEGESFLNDASCSDLRSKIDEINIATTIPLIQGTLKRASELVKNTAPTKEQMADAFFFAMQIVPVIESVSTEGNVIDTVPIRKMMEVFDITAVNPRGAWIKPEVTYKSIQEIGLDLWGIVDAIETAMPALSISCIDVGVPVDGQTNKCDFSVLLEESHEEILTYKPENNVKEELNVAKDVLKLKELVEEAIDLEIETDDNISIIGRTLEAEVITKINDLYEYGEFTTVAEILLDEAPSVVIPKGTKVLKKLSELEYGSDAYTTEECDTSCTVLKIAYEYNTESTWKNCRLTIDDVFDEFVAGVDCIKSGDEIYVPKIVQYDMLRSEILYPVATLKAVGEKTWQLYSAGRFSLKAKEMWTKFDLLHQESFKDRNMHQKLSEFYQDKHGLQEPEHDFANVIFKSMLDQTNEYETVENEIALQAAYNTIPLLNMIPVVVSELEQAVYICENQAELIEKDMSNPWDRAVAYHVGTQITDVWSESVQPWSEIEKIALKFYYLFNTHEIKDKKVPRFFKLREDLFETTSVENLEEELEPTIESLINKKIMTEFTNGQQVIKESVGNIETCTALAGIKENIEELFQTALLQEFVILAAMTEDKLGEDSPYKEWHEVESESLALAAMISPLYFGCETQEMIENNGGERNLRSMIIPNKFEELLKDEKLKQYKVVEALDLLNEASICTYDGDVDKENVFSVIVDGKENDMEDNVRQEAHATPF